MTSKKIVLLTNARSEISFHLIDKFIKKFPNHLIITTNEIPEVSIKDYLKYLIYFFLNFFKSCLKHKIYYYKLPNIKVENNYIKNINSDKTYDLIKKFSPDILCISGTKKVDKKILSLSKICLNLHNGYVPSYKGVSSPDWVVFEENYNYFFSTIHLATVKLDSGKILSTQNIKPYLFESYKSFKRRLHLTGNDLFVKTILEIDELEFIHQSSKIRSRNLKHSDKPPNFLKQVYKNYNSLNSLKFRFHNASKREKLLYSILNFKINSRNFFLNGIYILNYHDFVSEDMRSIENNIPSIFTDVSLFKKHIDFLKRHFEIISMNDALTMPDDELDENKKYLVLTIDDGFKSVYETVKYLSNLNIVPTIFLNNDPIINNKPLLNHKHYLVKKYMLWSKNNDLKKYLLEYDKLLKGIDIVDYDFKKFVLDSYLNTSDILKIKNLCEFGSHTASHKPLIKLNYRLQENQIKDAHNELKLFLNIDLKYFSFPFGKIDQRNFKSDYIASETANFIFMCEGGINKTHQLKKNMSRIGVHNENIKELEKLLHNNSFYL